MTSLRTVLEIKGVGVYGRGVEVGGRGGVSGHLREYALLIDTKRN